jgi:hypothetical protein
MVAAIRQRVSWLLMGIIAIAIIVIGFEGSLGKVLGCVFTPGIIVVGSESAGGGTPVVPPPGNIPPSQGGCPPGYIYDRRQGQCVPVGGGSL